LWNSRCDWILRLTLFDWRNRSCCRTDLTFVRPIGSGRGVGVWAPSSRSTLNREETLRTRHLCSAIRPITRSAKLRFQIRQKKGVDGTGCGIENKIRLLGNNPSLSPPQRLVKIPARSEQRASFSLVLPPFSVPKRLLETVPFRQCNQLTWGGHSMYQAARSLSKITSKSPLQSIDFVFLRIVFSGIRESSVS